VVSYDRTAFVVYRRMNDTIYIDVEYEVPQFQRTDGCGYRLDPQYPEARAMVQRIATALAALGAEGQPGVKAEPPTAAGRRYSARPQDFDYVSQRPPTE
jgi:hypothetical protein